MGFGSFLAYPGYGYLDTWHGVATLFLLPCFVVGVIRSRNLLSKPAPVSHLLKPSVTVTWRTGLGVGRLCLLATAVGMIFGGLTIMIVGMTSVFVPQDLKFMGITPTELHAINPHLVPLIAHDREGFGGGICACGITVLFCVWCGELSRSLWQALCVAGTVGFSEAILVHPIVGYNDLTHLVPALFGGAILALGLVLTYKPMCAKGPFSIKSPS